MTTRPAPATVPVPASAPASFSPRPDIRLVVTDMDGTLLDADGRVPQGLWPLLADLRRRGIVFSPASGRQYATLAHLFAGADDGMVYIAENGAFVVRDGVEVSSDPLDPAVAARLVKSVRQLTDEGVDVGVVVCGKRAAYIERGDQAFLDEVGRYYNAHRLVDDATAVDDEIVKVAVFDFGPIERTTAPALASFADTHQVVVSSEHWIDVMNHGADKGVAVRRLQEHLNIGPAQTMVFGDYLNDLGMLDAAEWSYAMANAHPAVISRARHLAPAHSDDGVVRTIRSVLDI
ncbi:Cof-type HAD-IIB family hydrolase [Streptomyces sp. NBC_00151]|uniref:Cof-type HAD-IIB family hydrolase n=1 Tax=Streptomyces sp. NBC_00151 TaxID=2975669 RepID=UPI002DDBD6CD|nr:Cof-type HAD-IIB family hydrolase [Streptomyces sp. NBC_00151]WRZ45487.1 Cof-type HAD-IIB family hydrolase [Streptomyces sp. NBC_00151]